MTISEVCEKYHLTADTLRYYEKIGVIPEVHRTAGGIRSYTEEDISWVENALCLRKSGLSMEAIAEYVRLCIQGRGTLGARRDLLISQRNEMKEQIRQMEETLARLDGTIAYFEKVMREYAEQDQNGGSCDE